LCTKIFPQKITADPNVKGVKRVKGPAAQILMWGIQFVRYGSFSAPGIELYSSAFEFPQLAVTIQSPSAAGLYAALLQLKAGRDLIDRVADAYDNNITENVSNRDVEGLYQREDGLLDLTKLETHFNTEKVYLDLHGTFLRGELLPSIGKDKGIMRSIGMLLKPHGTMIASVGAGLYRLGGAHLLTAEWESVAALDAAMMLGLNVVVSDGKISPARTGIPRPAQFSLGHKTNIAQMAVKSDTTLGTFFTYPLHVSSGHECYINLAYNYQSVRIVSEAKRIKSIQKGRTSHVDSFAHDVLEALPVFAKLTRVEGSAPVACFKAFIVMVPVRLLRFMPGNCPVKVLAQCYKLGFTPASLTSNHHMIMVGVAHNQGFPVKQMEVKMIFPHVITLLCKRMEIMNMMYVARVKSPFDVAMLQHHYMDANEFLQGRAKDLPLDRFMSQFTVDTTVVKQYDTVKVGEMVSAENLTDDPNLEKRYKDLETMLL